MLTDSQIPSHASLNYASWLPTPGRYFTRLLAIVSLVGIFAAKALLICLIVAPDVRGGGLNVGRLFQGVTSLVLIGALADAVALWHLIWWRFDARWGWRISMFISIPINLVLPIGILVSSSLSIESLIALAYLIATLLYAALFITLCVVGQKDHSSQKTAQVLLGEDTPHDPIQPTKG